MNFRKAGQGLSLLACTVVITALLRAMGLPAALLLGPMLAGIVLALGGAAVRFPNPPYILAQAVIGCLIARAATPAILSSLALGWHLFLGVVLSSIAVSAGMGWLLYRFGIMPGTTGIWGTSPGGATAMVVMADAYGADARLVAFMQYLRVLCVALSATLVARFWTDGPAEVQAATVWFPTLGGASVVTLGLVGLGAAVGLFTRIPSGSMLAPMLVGAALRLSGLAEIELPPWFLAASYAVIGWRIGLGFTRQVAVYATRALPMILTTIVTLIAFCGGLSWILARLTGVDALSAYLATSPGGLDSVAIIAATTPVDMPFVMTLQTLRFFLVVLLGPPMARFLAGKARENAGALPRISPEG
jgi:membrane AbrB-like protein